MHVFWQRWSLRSVSYTHLDVYKRQDYDSLNESEKAFAYFKKAAEYEWYSEGLGICYEMGIGVEDNETEAFKYYTLAADNGNTTSMYRTGLCYYNGVGVKQNYAEAYRWFTDAAGNGNIAATYYLGKMMMYGEGCTPDPETAVQWLLKEMCIRDRCKAGHPLAVFRQ